MAQTFSHNTLIVGAGAAGMMCAAHAGPGTLIIDHARDPGEKIRISGGGRCNFTNLHADARNFLSDNPHFAKSALRRYTPRDFIALVERHAIAYREKTLGQLFCDNSAKDIVAMLVAEATQAGARLALETRIAEIAKTESGFSAILERHGRRETVTCKNLVVATGGKSIPKMGATGFGYELAARFGHAVTATRPALVPLTFAGETLDSMKALSGVGIPARVSCGKTSFDEALLFTHRGLSGPAILQISSYWREGEAIFVNLLPKIDCLDHLRRERARAGKRLPAAALCDFLPKRLASALAARAGLSAPLGGTPDTQLHALSALVNGWELHPTGTEGYRTAEVTLGGIDTAGLDSRTMGSKSVPGLYFIGETVDVTGWLGGYNFQWAWSSGYAAGNAIANAF